MINFSCGRIHKRKSYYLQHKKINLKRVEINNQLEYWNEVTNVEDSGESTTFRIVEESTIFTIDDWSINQIIENENFVRTIYYIFKSIYVIFLY